MVYLLLLWLVCVLLLAVYAAVTRAFSASPKLPPAQAPYERRRR